MLRKVLTYTSLFSFLLMTTACDVDQTRSAELPDVDVEVETEPGQMPAYDVDWADVDVRMEERTIEVPKVRVVMETETVEVPVVDLDWPEEYGEADERTFAIEAEVDQETNLDISHVFTNGQRLIVVADLEEYGETLSDGERMRVSDQVIVNAPDLDTRYYIVGERPEGEFNKRYNYISNFEEIEDMMDNGRVIYENEAVLSR